MESTIFYIQGKTTEGEIFRPSDWAERLCGIMSSFTPFPSTTKNSKYLCYSPYVQPTQIEGIKSILVDVRLKDIEPKALQFLNDFAKSNNLIIINKVE